MARYTHAKCKLCRREGERLYLRGARCHTVKCAIARRPHPPGAQSFRRRRISDYGTQLREKQKAKRIYGVLERQFRRYYNMARRKKDLAKNLRRIKPYDPKGSKAEVLA